MSLGANASTPVLNPGANVSSSGNVGALASGALSDVQNFLTQQNLSFLYPLTAKGISGFEFDIPETDRVRLTADATENYVEDNSFINDHVVLKPAEIEMTGLIGELVNKTSGGLSGLLNQLQGKLSSLSAFIPNQTQGYIQKVQQAVSQAQVAVDVVNQAVQNTQNMVKFLANPLASNLTSRQQQAYQSLLALMYQKTVCSVLTPWAYFPSMIIVDIQLDQDAESQSKTEIRVKLHEWRTSGPLNAVNFDKTLYVSNSNQAQAQTPANTGNIKGKQLENSAAYDIVHGLEGL